MIPELVEDGLEGATYGAFTTLTNVAENIAGALSIQLLSVWDTDSDLLGKDNAQAKANMRNLQLLCVGIALSALFFVPILPDQKDDCARLKTLDPSPFMAKATTALIIIGMLYGGLLSILPLLPATQCLEIVGGSGC